VKKWTAESVTTKAREPVRGLSDFYRRVLMPKRIDWLYERRA